MATSTASSSSSRVGDAGVARDDGGGDAATPRDAAAPTDGSALAFDDAGCVEATIDFHVVAKPGNKFRYCLGAGECLGGSWLTLAVVDGGYVPSPALVGIPDLACGYGYESCNGCQDMGCTDTCSSPETLDDAGATATWGGKYFQGGMCGAAMNACAQTLCVAPGAYTVTFCGAAEPADASSAGQGCTGSDTPTCVVVPFTWPPPSGHAVVEGAIGDVE